MSPPAPQDRLAQRFSSLRRLRLSPSSGVEWVSAPAQSSLAACLTMILRAWGTPVDLPEVERELDAVKDPEGTEVLSRRGLRVRRIALGPGLTLEPYGSPVLVRLAGGGWAVVEHRHGKKVQLFDPSSAGPRPVALDSLMEDGRLVVFDVQSTLEKRGARYSFWRNVFGIILGSGLVARVLIASAMLQLFGLALPLITGAVVDRVVPRQDYSFLWVLSLGGVLVVAMSFSSMVLRQYLLNHLNGILDARLTLGFMDHLIQLPLSFFQTMASGDLMMRVNSNARLRDMLASGLLTITLDALSFVFYFGVLLFVDPAMAGIVFVLGALNIGAFNAFQGPEQRLIKAYFERQARTESYQVEMLNGIETVKAAGIERGMVDRWSHHLVDQLNVMLDRGRLGAFSESSSFGLQMFSPILILSFGAYQVLEGRYPLGMMLALTALAQQCFLPMGRAVLTLRSLQTVHGMVERITQVMRHDVERLPGAGRPVRQLRGALETTGLSFAFSAGAPEVVKNITMSVAPGRQVGIVGQSGSGKSTFAKLLVGLYTPTAGRVLYDGVDLKELELTSVRLNVGFVSQTPHLFAGTIRDNIALQDRAMPMERVIWAAKMACIHEDILALPDGYETTLRNSGARLSGGQRQRIALARALARDPQILLLDEATSALDGITEAQIQENLASLRCTRIVVAHRLSTVLQSDEILVFAHGAVVERGTHAQLLEAGGHYAALVGAQASSETGDPARAAS